MHPSRHSATELDFEHASRRCKSSEGEGHAEDEDNAGTEDRKIRKMRDVGRGTGAAARDRWPRQKIICQERSMTDSVAAIATAGLLFITCVSCE